MGYRTLIVPRWRGWREATEVEVRAVEWWMESRW